MGYQYLTKWIEQRTNDPSVQPVFLNIAGRAGCGKTFILRCLKSHIVTNYGPNFIKTAAPTGTASFLIEGKTLHSLLKIPPKISKEKPLPPLNDNLLRSLQEEFENCEMIVIDENDSLKVVAYII